MGKENTITKSKEIWPHFCKNGPEVQNVRKSFFGEKLITYILCGQSVQFNFETKIPSYRVRGKD